MSFFTDLSTESMIDAGDHVRAIGWLSKGQPFPQGDMPPEFVARLREFVRLWWPSTEALGWGVFHGKHRCEFCLAFDAFGNFGVPDGPILFVAPEMVTHYVEAHCYCPPAEFVSAVLKAPLPDTEAYRAVVEPFRRLHEAFEARRRETPSIQMHAGRKNRRETVYDNRPSQAVRGAGRDPHLRERKIRGRAGRRHDDRPGEL
jgi:hypothetical protein